MKAQFFALFALGATVIAFPAALEERQIATCTEDTQGQDCVVLNLLGHVVDGICIFDPKLGKEEEASDVSEVFFSSD
ncbi:hypothetical protein MMC10_010141 [Thelotrema lepadinum]|nr:hypothetical protein [Thelotrema lepadinum]